MRNGAGKTLLLKDGANPGGILSHCDLPSTFSSCVHHPFADITELVMGIIAWISSALLAQRLLPGRNAQGFALTCTARVCGALFGGWTSCACPPARSLTVMLVNRTLRNKKLI
jgi:uncharacterized membrane protein YeaQ/YmgE (transglycosylase-associated protein family)